MVTVVMSVYNGTRYLTEQLDSLRLQTVSPDRVLIADDCSTDGSFDLISEYIEKHGLDNWTINKNSSNFGWRMSFKRLLDLASIDDGIVFPCDQDDIWKPDKIAVMSSIIEKDPSIDVLCCAVEPFYENGGKKVTVYGAVDISKPLDDLEAPVFDSKFMSVRRPGCSYAVKSDFIRDIMPYWQDDFAHDGMLWRFSLLKGSLRLLNQPLIKFRRHDSNATEMRHVDKKSRVAEIKMLLRFSKALEEYCTNNPGDYCAFSAYIEHCRFVLDARLHLLEGGFKFSDLGTILKYRKYGLSNRSMLGDLKTLTTFGDSR